MNTLSAITKYLKEVLAPQVVSQYYKETPLLSMLQKNSGVETDVNGKFYVVVRKNRFGGTAAIAENETLPTGKLAPERLQIDPKYIFVGFKVTDQVLSAMKKGAKAIANYMAEAEETMRDDLATFLNRVFLQNGDGTIATAASAGSNSTTLTLSASSPNGDVSNPAELYFAPGMYIKIGSAAAVEVVSVDSATQLTLAAQRTWAANDPVKIVGPDGSTDVEPTGLKTLIATTTGTVQGINRATNPWWIPHVFSTATTYNTARQLENKVVDLLTQAARYGNFKNFAIFTNRSGYRRLAADIQSVQRVVNEKEMPLGFSALNFSVRGKDVPVILDWDVPDGHIYGVNFDSITLAELSPVEWLEFDAQGNILRLAGKAAYEGYLKYYVNLGLKHAKSNFAIVNGTFTV